MEAVLEVVDFNIRRENFYTVVVSILQTKQSEQTAQPFSYWDPFAAPPSKDLTWLAFGYTGRGNWQGRFFDYVTLPDDVRQKIEVVKDKLHKAGANMVQILELSSEETEETQDTLETCRPEGDLNKAIVVLDMMIAAFEYMLEDPPRFPAPPLIAHQVMMKGEFLPVRDFPVPVWIGNGDKMPGHQLIKHIRL